MELTCGAGARRAKIETEVVDRLQRVTLCGLIPTLSTAPCLIYDLIGYLSGLMCRPILG